MRAVLLLQQCRPRGCLRLTPWRGYSRSSLQQHSPGRAGGGSLWRPAAFTLVVGATTYGASAIYRYELHSRWVKHYWAEAHERGYGILAKAKNWWRHLNVADRFCYTIIALNCGVFLLWRIPSLHFLMERYFLSSIAHKSSLSLLLCEFSHIEFWHLGLNMLVFWSFAPALLRTLGDTLSPLNAWPYYITGGVFASMVGYYGKMMKGTLITSLGASGALMAVVSLVVFNNPDASVYIIFLPFIPIPASMALAGVVTMDVLGIVRGWQFLDHAAHLGGVLFAVLYHLWLQSVIVKAQVRVARTWHRMKIALSNSRQK